MASWRRGLMHVSLTNDFALILDDDKFYRLGERMTMACVGDGGDADEFAEYIVKNVHLYKLRCGYELDPEAVATFARKAITDNLRTSEPYAVNFILGGYNQTNGPYVTMVDYLGTMFQAPFVMYGYGSMFCYSILDRLYRDGKICKICLVFIVRGEYMMRLKLQKPGISIGGS
ncbi:unnamed protein product [Soboliphyme baturini]|uniref:Proteasome subunit beta n=1 Tax=Soboliphyme baturini TaxID=241478 RepID=A0A183IUF1_9BILA|nr:unnamed protein product [Soboliphyme baturini]